MASNTLPSSVWSSTKLPAPPTADAVAHVADFLNKLGYSRTVKALVKEAQSNRISLNAGQGTTAKTGPLARPLGDLYIDAFLQEDDEEEEAAEDTSGSESESDDDSSEDDSVDTQIRIAVQPTLKRKHEEIEPDTSSSESESEASPSDDSDSDTDSDSDSSASEEPPAKKAKQTIVPDPQLSTKMDVDSTASAQETSDSDSSSESEDESSESGDDGSSDDESAAEETTSVGEAVGATSDSDSSSDDDSSDDTSVAEETTNASDAVSATSDSDSSSDSDSESDSDSDSDASAKGTPTPTRQQVLKTDASSNVSDTSASSATMIASPKDENAGMHPARASRMEGAKAPVKVDKKTNVPFSRISRDQFVDPRFSSNGYVSYDYADRAHQDLVVTKGKGFTKEKNKKKRGSYRGGWIDTAPKGIKFDD